MLINKLNVRKIGQSGYLYQLGFGSNSNPGSATYINWSHDSEIPNLKNLESSLFENKVKVYFLRGISFSTIFSIMEEVTQYTKSIKYEFKVPEDHFRILAGNDSAFKLNGRTVEFGQKNGKFYYKVRDKIL